MTSLLLVKNKINCHPSKLVYSIQVPVQETMMTDSTYTVKSVA